METGFWGHQTQLGVLYAKHAGGEMDEPGTLLVLIDMLENNTKECVVTPLF